MPYFGPFPVYKTDTTWYYDPKSKTVSGGPDMPFETSDHCIVGPLGHSLDEYLLLGGFGDHGNAAALYDESADSWTLVPDRYFTRRRMACTKIRDNSSNDFVLVAGAYDDLFCFQWFFRGFLSLVGGMTGDSGSATSVDSVEIFSLATRTWNRVAGLPVTR